MVTKLVLGYETSNRSFMQEKSEIGNKVTYKANLIGGASSGKACRIDTLKL
jgi:hypothetical protein